jgi:peroxiredoxin
MLPSLWLFAALSSALAGPSTPPRTVLSGHFANAPAGDTVQVQAGEEFLKIPLSPSGDFRVELPMLKVPMPLVIDYVEQRARLYIVPGDQLRLTLDYKNFDKSLAYSGRGADANNYLAQARWKFELDPASDVPRPADQLTQNTIPAEMRRNADVFRQRQLDFLAAYAKAHKLSADFQREMKLIFAVDWAVSLLRYANSKYQPGVPGTGVPDSYFDFMTQVPVQELNQHLGRSIADNSLMANLVVYYQRRLLPSGQLSTDPTEGPRLYQLATAELGEGATRDWVMRALLGSNLRGNLPGALAFYPTFRLHTTDSATARNMRDAFKQSQLLGVGKPAPAFTLTDNTGKKVSLSDLRGKVVYLDFWGTWCSPCMKEMTESAPALKKKFEGRDVVFLYISVGDPEDKWQKTLTEKQFTSPNSVHLRSATNDEAAAYQVSGYPSYYLIDREGRFVQLYTSRPSEGDKTVAAIEQALVR